MFGQGGGGGRDGRGWRWGCRLRVRLAEREGVGSGFVREGNVDSGMLYELATMGVDVKGRVCVWGVRERA